MAGRMGMAFPPECPAWMEGPRLPPESGCFPARARDAISWSSAHSSHSSGRCFPTCARDAISEETADNPDEVLPRTCTGCGGDFCIGGACYPEVHPESRDQREDILHLKEKVDAGAEFLTTQMFFDNDLLYNFLTTQMVFDNNLFFNFLYKLREAGVTCPVLPGIMPITNAYQVDRAIKLSGSFMPYKFKSLVDKFGSDSDAMKQAGIAYAISQIIDLYANGVQFVHVYTMNKPDVALAIQSGVSDILGKKI